MRGFINLANHVEPKPQVVNVEQAATLLKCSRRTIYNMIDDGRLDGVGSPVGMKVTRASLRTAKLNPHHGRRRAR